MVGYNSSKYDLNIIKKYFITHIGAEKQVTVAKKQGRIMFLSTPFQPQISSFWTFVIIWGQARVMRGGWKCMEAARQNHGCHMSGLTVLTDCIMMACRWIVVGSQNWKTSLSCCWRSMRTASRCSGSREWEHLTVGWSITTIWMSAPSWMHKKKGEDFTQGFVSTCDDAVSLLGVSLQYLLRGMLQGRNLSELYAPEKEAYEMQKGAVVGGPSLVFTRKHEVRKTTTAPPHKSRTTRVRVKRLFVMTLTHCTGVLFWKKCLVGQERWLTTKIQPKLGGFKSRAIPKSVVWFLTSMSPESCGQNSKNSHHCFTTAISHPKRLRRTWKSICNEPRELGYKLKSFVKGWQGKRSCFTPRYWNGTLSMVSRSRIEPLTTDPQKY